VVIITGSGDYFSSGAELKADLVDLDVAQYHARNSPSGLMMWEIMHFPKPVIALVNGPAIGIGFTILPHFDFVFCTKDTFFWSPFGRAGVRSRLSSLSPPPLHSHKVLSPL